MPIPVGANLRLGDASVPLVSEEPALEADVGLGVDEELQMEPVSDLWPIQHEEAFQNDYRSWFEVFRFLRSPKVDVTIARSYRNSTLCESLEVLNEKRVLDCRGVVEIRFCRFFVAQMGKVPIVPVLLDEGHLIRERRLNTPSEPGLS